MQFLFESRGFDRVEVLNLHRGTPAVSPAKASSPSDSTVCSTDRWTTPSWGGKRNGFKKKADSDNPCGPDPRVPFIRGGAEVHAEGLRDALRRFGHEAEILAIPFKWYPPEKILDHMLACQLLDVSEVAGTPVDRVIGLKFPAYLIPHPNKVLWIAAASLPRNLDHIR